jgi:hypothetical protein
MPDVFWIGLVIAACGTLIGLVAGVRSRGTSTRAGLAIGVLLGVLSAFPLLALGLSTA